MLVKVIGCGTAFSKKLFNQCFLLTEEFQGETRKMLIDFGAKIPMALDYHGIDMKEIDDVYISHSHSDHIGGLEEFAFSRYDWQARPRKWDDYKYKEGSELLKDSEAIKEKKEERTYLKDNVNYKKYAPRLICNKHMLKELWEKSLCGGLESMEGFVAGIDTYFEPFPVNDNVPFYWQGWKCELIWQIHIVSGSILKHTFGLMMSKSGSKTMYFTTDAQHCSPNQVTLFYDQADLIFQDCECIGINSRSYGPDKKLKMDFSSGVHANYGELAGYESANNQKLSVEIRNKMWLSHYNELDWDELASQDGFAGFLKLGQEFTI